MFTRFARAHGLLLLSVFALLFSGIVVAAEQSRSGKNSPKTPPPKEVTLEEAVLSMLSKSPQDGESSGQKGHDDSSGVKRVGEDTPKDNAVHQDDGGDNQATTSVPSPIGVEVRDPKTYKYWSFLPAAIAILIAIFARQVVPALVVGVFVGAYMLVPCEPAGSIYAQMSGVVAGFRMAAEKYVLGSALDSDHMTIIMFTLIIGFTVGVIGRNGGTAGMVRVITGKTESARRGALTAWFAGLVVFFDDYANTMIIGPTMAPIFDRVRISRAKLAYIIDSTAAPVASLAVIGTWVGAEIGFIDAGLDKLAVAGTPGFLDGVSGMSAFLNSLAYRFYPILALVLVFLVAATGRDFGPMRKSQSRCAGDAGKPQTQASALAAEVERSDKSSGRWWLGFVPVAFLVGATLVILAISGSQSEKTVAAMNAVTADGSSAWDVLPLWEKASILIGNAKSYLAIFYGAILSAFVAVILTLIARTCAVHEAVDAGLNGMSRMFPAVVILVLAWAISSVSKDLELGAIAGDYLRQAHFAPHFIPLAVFVSSAVISFATGTSWATMGILCPVTVSIVAGLASKEIAAGAMTNPQALTLFYEAVGSVLAGSIFGDHCSPISDTTVLSSIASGCPHEEHVWTQLPYALLTALVAIGASEVVCDGYNQPWYVGLAAGTATLVLIVFVLGRKPKVRLDLDVVRVKPPPQTEMEMS